MAVTIEPVSTGFFIKGDGVATSCSLALDGYPFIDFPKTWRAVSVIVNEDGNGNISGAAVNGNMVDLTFSSAFSGSSGSIKLVFTFDLP